MPLPTHFTLNNGQKIPAVGFWNLASSPGQVEGAVEIALKSGYRHIDCAAVYRNEAEVGQGIRNSGVARSEIFITSKLWNTKHAPEDVEPALDKTLKNLGVDYLDLLSHALASPGDLWFPLNGQGIFQLGETEVAETYRTMEKLLDSGKVRAIGVSNFNIRRLEDLMAKTGIVPAVNQVEAHPYLQQPELLKFCQAKGILLEAYSPLGNNLVGEPKTVDDPVVAELGSALDMDIGQVLYSWGIQRGTVVLPKSVTPHRIESNLHVSELPEDAFTRLNGLERHKRFNFPGRWGIDIFDEVGDEAAKLMAQQSGKANLEKFGEHTVDSID